MPQHLPYKLPEDGYYYFRPYHYTQVAIQQDFVSTWGGDRRNPYSFEVFDRLETEELPGVDSSEPLQGPSQPSPQMDDPRPSPLPPQSKRLPAARRPNSVGPNEEPLVEFDRLGLVR